MAPNTLCSLGKFSKGCGRTSRSRTTRCSWSSWGNNVSFTQGTNYFIRTTKLSPKFLIIILSNQRWQVINIRATMLESAKNVFKLDQGFSILILSSNYHPYPWGWVAILNESISKTCILRARQFQKIKCHIRFFCHMIFGNLSWEQCEFSPLN